MKLGGRGEVSVGGLKVEKSHLAQVRAKVGLVFQNPDDQLFSPTVFEDVAFGPLHMGYLEAEVRERVDHALAQVGMSADKRPPLPSPERGGEETDCDCDGAVHGP